ncbi:MAG: SDR family NAD(P)-dependent oxidoreductase [Methylobacteriaceae bacterium]|nr:SDR family NAD(P)-dependent oxidoreductase [Methylobacteriaceae bacterium]
MKLDATIAAIVTGGASGLGEATARGLAAAGAKVAIFDMQQDKGEAVAAAIGGLFCKVDVTDEASIDAGLAKARAAHGIERILVNCAGVAPAKRLISKKRDTGELVAHDVASFARGVAINLTGTFAMIARCATAMASLAPLDADGQRGVVVSTASVAAEDGQIGQATYAASKAGVLGMTLPLARDLAQYGVRVCTILPGLFHTPMFDGLPEESRASLAKSVPFPSRLGRADEYARLVLSIVDNDMLNGVGIRLDGAIRLAPR